MQQRLGYLEGSQQAASYCSMLGSSCKGQHLLQSLTVADTAKYIGNLKEKWKMTEAGLG